MEKFIQWKRRYRELITNMNEVDSRLSPVESIYPNFLTPQFSFTNYLYSHDNDLKGKIGKYMKETSYIYPNFPKELVRSQLHLDRYIKFIDSRQQNRIKSKEIYTESHHKIPRSLEGSNIKENMIRLTAREHFIAHLILYKTFGGSMWYAFNMMRINPLSSKRYFNLSSKQYEHLKEERPRHSEKTKKLIGEKNKGKKRSQEFKNILSKKMKNNTHGKNYKRTEESKIQQSQRQMGTKRSLATKKLMSQVQLGHLTSEKTKQKIGQGNLGKKRTEIFKENRSKTTHFNKKWKLISPEGNIYYVSGLLKFCEQYQLSYELFRKNKGETTNMKVSSKLGKNTLGWIAFLIEEEL